MTTKTLPLAELRDIERALRDSGYQTTVTTLGRFSRILLAENPYALLAAFETETWEGLLPDVADVQAELTQIAATAERAAIRWDLYVFVHVRTPGLHSVPADTVEAIESDTRYARKFVRVNLLREAPALDRALRPLLPLRPSLKLDPVDPLVLVRSELLKSDVPPNIVEQALRSFRESGEVRLP